MGLAHPGPRRTRAAFPPACPLMSDLFSLPPADPADPAVLAFVPPLLGYRALAPASFAEFGTASPDPQNALSSIGMAGPGPLTSEALVPAPGPTMVGSDAQVSSPRARK